MPTNEDHEKLPPNLFIGEASGQCLYRDPRTGRTKDLGKDRSAATALAAMMNVGKGVRKQAPFGRRLVKMAAFVPGSGLLSEEQIRDLAQPIKQLCGVYLLLRDGLVVYVGQSANCHARIGRHFDERGKKFDAHHIIECKPKDLKKLEAQYIGKFVPQYNLLVPKTSEEQSIAA